MTIFLSDDEISKLMRLLVPAAQSASETRKQLDANRSFIYITCDPNGNLHARPVGLAIPAGCLTIATIISSHIGGGIFLELSPCLAKKTANTIHEGWVAWLSSLAIDESTGKRIL